MFVVTVLPFLPFNLTQEAETKILWVHKTLVTNFFSAYWAGLLSGWIAPKFKFIAVSVCSSVLLAMQLYVLFDMATLPFHPFWTVDDIWVTLSVVAGAIAAIIHANISEYNFRTKKRRI